MDSIATFLAVTQRGVASAVRKRLTVCSKPLKSHTPCDTNRTSGQRISCFFFGETAVAKVDAVILCRKVQVWVSSVFYSSPFQPSCLEVPKAAGMYMYSVVGYLIPGVAYHTYIRNRC